LKYWEKVTKNLFVCIGYHGNGKEIRNERVNTKVIETDSTAEE